MAKVQTLPVAKKGLVSGKYPNFHKTGSITGMKRMYYGQDALLVRCGSYIYNVRSSPDIYHNEAH